MARATSYMDASAEYMMKLLDARDWLHKAGPRTCDPSAKQMPPRKVRSFLLALNTRKLIRAAGKDAAGFTIWACNCDYCKNMAAGVGGGKPE